MNLKQTEEKNKSLITIGEKCSIKSDILGEDRPYWVYLPASYEDTEYTLQDYPVLYILDGDIHFHSATGVINFMSAGMNIQIPEFIVIAIPNTDRTKDLTPTHSITDFEGKEVNHFETSGGADSFLKFIEEELFPEIESKYRTRPFRVLVGHSFGGLLALHTLLEKPDLFQAHIAIDPSVWWDNEVLTQKAKRLLSEGHKLKGNTYISLANNYYKHLDDPSMIMNMNKVFISALEPFESSEFKLKSQYFDKEDHSSVPLLSLYYGLLYIFEDYRLMSQEIIGQPSLLKTHFEKASEKLGFEFKAPEKFIEWAGYYFIHDSEDVDKALQAFYINASHYPESYRVYMNLAEAYVIKEDTPLAIKNYKKAIELKSDLQKLKDRLREIEEG